MPHLPAMPEFSRVCFSEAASSLNGDYEPRESVANAIRSNPRNGSLAIPAGNVSFGPSTGPLQLASYTRKFWKAGQELNISFSAGTKWQKDKVQEIAPQWCQYANIKFNFTQSGTPDILIDFNPTKGSWSYLGTDCTYFSSKGQPSMNLGWIIDQKPEADIRQVILHEFGHALGAVHEHQNPTVTIPWNKEVVYKELGGEPNKWDKDTVDNAMFTKYSTQDVQATMFDGDSIMLYYYPANWTTDGKGTNYNTSLSDRDKSYIQFCYPAKSYDAGQFNTQEVRPWNQPRTTNATEKYFYEKYPSVPALPLGLTMLDIDAGANIRVSAVAQNITQEKFTASLNTWADTTLWSAGLTWLEASPRFTYLRTGTFHTGEIRPWNAPQLENKKRITFATPFKDAQPPKIVCFLNLLDIDRNTNWRVKAYASDIDANGFTIHVDTWADTILYSAGVTWLAYPADTPGVASGHFSTEDVRPWNKPQSENSATASFAKPFTGAPKVLMALDSLDYEHGKNLRLRLSTSAVTPKGVTWHLQSWWDSIMYRAGASYFAWE